MKNNQQRINKVYKKQLNLADDCDIASLRTWVEQVIANLPKQRLLYTDSDIFELVPSKVTIEIKVKALKNK